MILYSMFYFSWFKLERVIVTFLLMLLPCSKYIYIYKYKFNGKNDFDSHHNIIITLKNFFFFFFFLIE